MNELMHKILAGAGFERPYADAVWLAWYRYPDNHNENSENGQKIVFGSPWSNGHAFYATNATNGEVRYGNTAAELRAAIDWLDSLRP